MARHGDVPHAGGAAPCPPRRPLRGRGDSPRPRRPGQDRRGEAALSRVVPATDERAVEEAAAVLDAGGLVVLPTDTVYGLAARLDRPSAVSQIFDVKHRPRSKPLAVLVADLAAAERLAAFTQESRRLAAEGWPGALTLVVPRAGRGPDLGGDGAAIALRVPDHPVALALLRRVGPLAATSANPSGRPTPATVAEIAAMLADAVALYVDGGPLGTAPSRVVSLLGPPRVLRE